MRKFLLRAALLSAAIFSVSALIGGQTAHAKDYTVTVTTYVPTGSAGEFTSGGYPNITGGAYIRQIAIANAGATAQTISVYDTCTSSTAATLAGVFDVPATIGTYWAPSGNTFLPQIFKLTNPCITKSSTSSVVQATFFYE
jgi:hypothetical protein